MYFQKFKCKIKIDISKMRWNLKLKIFNIKLVIYRVVSTLFALSDFKLNKRNTFLIANILNYISI